MKKILLIMTIICQICAVAQEEKNFRFIPEFNGYMFCPVSDARLYASSCGNSIWEIDTNYSIKQYRPENTQLKVSDKWSALVEIKHWKDNIYWASMGRLYSHTSRVDTLGGFLVFKIKTDSNDFEVLHKYNSYNVKGFAYYHNNPNKVEGFCFDKTGEYVYFLASPTALVKMRTENPDTIEYMIDFYKTGLATAEDNQMVIDHEDKLWYTTYTRRIPIFDTKTEEWTIYDSTNLPFLKNMYMQDMANTDALFQFCNMLHLSAEYNNAVIVIGNHRGSYLEDNMRIIDTIVPKVLKYENKQWDTIPLPYELIDRKTTDGRNVRSYYFDGVRQWSKDEIVFLLRDTYRAGFAGVRNQHKLLIYNLLTKEWRNFIIPSEGIYASAYGSVYDVVSWNKQHYIMNSSLVLWIYDPNGFGAIEETATLNSSLLAPNPAGDDCTLSMDLTEASNITISLSDMLGRDIMQIYDGYADVGTFTKTFNTRRLTSGVYSVIIRIGDKAKAEKLIINR